VWNPDFVGEDDLIVCQILFAEAVVDVVHCAWAVPDHPRTSVEMTFLLWARACGAGDSGGSITLRLQSGILLRQRGGILSGWGGILL
jgi:hypothetical protein